MDIPSRLVAPMSPTSNANPGFASTNPILVFPTGVSDFSPTNDAQRMRGFSPKLSSFRNADRAKSANPVFRASSSEGLSG